MPFLTIYTNAGVGDDAVVSEAAELVAKSLSSSMVICGRPICFPFALAFSMPERTRERIMASSS